MVWLWVRPAVQSQWWSPLVLHVMIASPKALHPQARFGCTVQCGLEKCMRMWSWVWDPVSHGHSWAWAVLSWLGWLKLNQLGWIALLLKKNCVQWIDLSVCFICISVVFIAETSLVIADQLLTIMIIILITEIRVVIIAIIMVTLKGTIVLNLPTVLQIVSNMLICQWCNACMDQVQHISSTLWCKETAQKLILTELNSLFIDRSH